MNNFESIIRSSNTKDLTVFYKNMKKIIRVQYNKQDYARNLTNILILFGKVDKPKQPLVYNHIHLQFTLRDFKELFGNFRQTLMNGRSKKTKIENLLKLGHKVNALRRYYAEFQ